MQEQFAIAGASNKQVSTVQKRLELLKKDVVVHYARLSLQWIMLHSAKNVVLSKDCISMIMEEVQREMVKSINLQAK